MEHQCLDNTHGLSEIARKYDLAVTVWSTNVSTIHMVSQKLHVSMIWR